MSNYRVKLILLSKADRKHFEFLKLNHKQYHSIAVIDECLKHIQNEVRQTYQKPVKLRCHLVEMFDVDDGKKQEKIELGAFDYEIKSDTQFLSENRFYQIVETEIYLNSSNVDDDYKEEVLKNIKQAKEMPLEGVSGKQSKNQRKGKLKNIVFSKWLKKKTDVSEPKDPQENLIEDLEVNTPAESEAVPEQTERAEKDGEEKVVQETEKQLVDDANEDKTKDTVSDQSDDDVQNEQEADIDTEATEEVNAPTKLEKTDTENNSVSAFESFDTLIDIPDFHLPKVKSRDIFLKQSDDPVENKKLSFLFDRETRLVSYKEKRLVEIYQALVEKYHDYLLSNEQDIDAKLEEYEQTRDTFIEEFTHDFKAQTKEKLDKKIKTVEQQHQAEHDDFIAQQQQALHRFEERQNSEQEEIITAYKEQLQNEVKAEKQKANKQFEEQKKALKEELNEKVEKDVYNYMLLDKQKHIQKLNDEVFKFDEQTYRQLDHKSKAWKTEVENQQHQEQTRQHEGMEQSKYEAEKEKAQAEIFAMKEKDREREANAQRLRAQELENKQNEMAYKQEEQRLKAIEVDAKHKEAEAKKKEAERMIPLNVRKIAGIVSGAVLVLFILIMFAFQLFFTDEPTYAELIDNEDYVEAYEQHPNRYNDLLQTVYEAGDVETIEYLAEQKPDDATTQLYQAVSAGESDSIIQAYQNVENPQQLDDAVLMTVADQYLDQQNIESAEAVNTHINDSTYSEKIEETKNYLNIKQELENVIEDSDDDEAVENAEKTLAQINTILNIQEETE